MARIIVLDDNQDTCDAIALRLVDRDGHVVFASTCASEAIDKSHAFRPDLLIADWNLDDPYDGLEVCRAIRFANPEVKLILTTGYDIEDVRQMTGAELLCRLIPKPFSMDDISTIVAKALTE